jgi:dihydroorotase, multifunctional complex type
MKNILLKNCDLSGQIKDILIINNIITEIEDNIDSDDAEVYNAEGHKVTPAFIDTHCHLRDPGFTHKEDITTGTAAAFAGGYSAVVAMPNTNPVMDNPDTLDYVTSKAAYCKVYPTAAITVGQNGEELCDFETLTAHGAVAFTDDGRPVANAAMMYEAMKICAEHGYLIMSHPEELSMGANHLAEDLAIAREIMIAEETGCRLHLAHVSTKTGMRLVREAKQRGVKVTCETCPHYFSFTKDALSVYGANAKMNPPLRTQVDLEAVIEAIKDGTVDTISTDHAPHTEAEKSVDLKSAPNGITGLQTAFAAGITNLVMPGHITFDRLIELMAYNPAKILGIDVSIKVGNPANLNVIDETAQVTVNREDIKSKSFNTPFLGQVLYGKIIRSVTEYGI